MNKPQAITNSDLLLDYWFSQFVSEQQKTNNLLEKVLENLGKPKPVTRKKKEGENTCKE
jgi:hypothetical protein